MLTPGDISEDFRKPTWYIRTDINGHQVYCAYDSLFYVWDLRAVFGIQTRHARGAERLPLSILLYLLPQPYGVVTALRGCSR